MKVFYVILGLAILNIMPFACKADDAYSFFVSMPGGVTSYDKWLATVNASASSSDASNHTAIDTGRYIGQSAAGALGLGFFTRFASSGTGLKSTPTKFAIIVR